MGFWGTLAKIGGGIAAGVAAPFTGGASLTALPTILGGAAGALGAMSQGQAQNRGEKFGGQLDYDRLVMDRDRDLFNRLLAREQEGRASGQDAWRRLLSAQRTLSPGPRPRLSPYSVAPREATGSELQGADAMTQEVMARLTGGNPIARPTASPMITDPRLLNPGAMERILGIASPLLGVAGQMAGRRR